MSIDSGKGCEDRIPRHWAMDGVFPGELGLWQGDAWVNQKRFVAERGFHGSGIGLPDLDNPGRAAVLEDLEHSHGQRWAVHVGVDYREDPDAARGRLDAAAQRLVAACGRHALAHATLIVRAGHRFDRGFPLERQLDALERQLVPFVAACRGAGLPVAIENHGDYYVSDLVQLCGRVPGLEIQFDTGNCFLIGERPDLVPDAAFPLVRSTHWKDHHVRPNLKTLHFELTGATLGRGAVGLDKLYTRLLALHPNPASVWMRVEWVPDPERPALDCFADSLAHLEKLSAGRFTAKAG